MKKSEAFKGDYMRASAYEVGHKFVARICGEEVATFTNNGRTEKKLALKLTDHEEMFIVGKINWLTIETDLGNDDSAHWIGAWLEIVVGTCEMRGETVKCLRVVKAAWPAKTAKKGKTSVTAPPPPPMDDDEIPF